MANAREVPLDEVQFRREDVLAYWGGVHTNSIHGYFKESPFFDHTSRNGLLWEQGFLNQDTFELCANRERLEATLRAGTGLEFMVVGEPKSSGDPAKEGPDSGVWVLRKQDRAPKRQTTDRDDLTIHGTYFAVGENIYQAPSVYDVVGNHLMSAMTSLSKFVDQAAALPVFNPSSGYSYVTAPTSVAAASTTSREASVAATDNMAEQSQSAVSHCDKETINLLQQSLALMRDHGDEYMDENPLTGEPGNFNFTHTKERVRAQKAAELEAAAAAAAALTSQRTAEISNVTKSESATPMVIKTEDQLDSAEARPKKQSRSEAGGSSAGNTAKKRRKSKAAGLLSSDSSAKNSPVLGAAASP